eukprot:COSAG01_NODE_5808_length_4021_cov_1.614482_3_plen_70_part_00
MLECLPGVLVLVGLLMLALALVPVLVVVALLLDTTLRSTVQTRCCPFTTGCLPAWHRLSQCHRTDNAWF